MRVLAHTSPARGHLYPIVPILKELRDRGHDVAVCTLAAELPHVRKLGMAVTAIDPRIEAIQHDDFGARSPVAALKQQAERSIP